MAKPLWHIICGSTGAGKTTYAIALAERLGAIRFSIDEWMAQLFWMDSPEPVRLEWTIERVNRCEKMIASLAADLVKNGVPCVLDLGFTRADHRFKFSVLADEANTDVQIHFVDVPAEERWQRVEARNREKGDTYRLEVTREMFDFMESIWEPPTPEEMAASNGVKA